MLLQEPSPVSPLARKGGAYPVREWGGYNPDGLSGFGLFPYHHQSLRASSLLRRPESLHFIDRHRVQIEVVDQRRDVPGLLPDDLRSGVLQNAGPVTPRLKLGAHEIFDRLAYAPNARVSLAGGPI